MFLYLIQACLYFYHLCLIILYTVQNRSDHYVSVRKKQIGLEHFDYTVTFDHLSYHTNSV